MIDRIITLALEEDTALGDITSENIFSTNDKSNARLIAKEDLILCGVDLAKDIFEYVDRNLVFKTRFTDGEKLKKGTIIATVSGATLSILKAERTALNFMQRMSGIATQANKLNAICKKYGVMLVDTRKTQPALRKFDKYAVKIGGAKNHRMSLSDEVLIKDNHIAAAGSITKAVQKIRASVGHTNKIEVETKNLDEVKEALKAGADIIMLDNMAPKDVAKIVKFVNGRVTLEASGGINASNLEEYAKTGVNVISMGCLTHSVKSADISLLI